jgi:hypothetical protein
LDLTLNSPELEKFQKDWLTLDDTEIADHALISISIRIPDHHREPHHKKPIRTTGNTNVDWNTWRTQTDQMSIPNHDNIDYLWECFQQKTITLAKEHIGEKKNWRNTKPWWYHHPEVLIAIKECRKARRKWLENHSPDTLQNYRKSNIKKKKAIHKAKLDHDSRTNAKLSASNMSTKSFWSRSTQTIKTPPSQPLKPTGEQSRTHRPRQRYYKSTSYLHPKLTQCQPTGRTISRNISPKRMLYPLSNNAHHLAPCTKHRHVAHQLVSTPLASLTHPYLTLR